MSNIKHILSTFVFAALLGALIGCDGGEMKSGGVAEGDGRETTAPAPAANDGTDAQPKADPPAESASSESASTDAESKSDTDSDTDQAATDDKLLFKNLEELEELIAEHKGKVVVVDYWSTWCAPCVREFPHLVELQKTYGEDVVCISASCNYDGLPDSPPESFREEVQNFLNENNAADLINVVMTVEAEVLFEQLKLASIPAVYVYNRDGELAKRFDNEDPEKLKESGEFSYEKDINPLAAELVAAEAAEEQ